MFTDGSCSGDLHGVVGFPSEPFHGDFYRESDDVMRGITFHAGPATTDATFAHEPWHEEMSRAMFESKGELDGMFCPANGCQSGLQMELRNERSTVPAFRFQEADEPPQMTADTRLYLEGTTLFVSDASPAELGNCLLDLLVGEMTASIEKVNRNKFTIKAVTMFEDGLTCVVKVRFHQDESGFAIEFQRRSGDSVAFNKTYRRASEYLESRTNSLAPRLKASQEPSATLPDCEGYAGQNSILPLIVIGEQTQDAKLQTEVASCLFAHSLKDEFAAQLCTSRVSAMLSKFLLTDSPSVVHPTTHLLSRLAERPGPDGFNFVTKPLLTNMIKKALMRSVAVVDRMQLANSVRCMVGRHGATISGELVDEVILAMDEALANRAKYDEVGAWICADLRQALLSLQTGNIVL